MSRKKQAENIRNKRSALGKSSQKTKKKNVKRLNQIKKKSKKRNKQKQIIMELILGLFLTVVLVYFQSFFFFSLIKVDSYAMSPTLKLGDIVLVEKKKKIQRQDIVLIKRESAQITELKRVIGLPTEKVDYKNNQLFINDEERAEPFIALEKKASFENGFVYTKDFSLYDLTRDTKIPEGSFFVMGDNRLYSTDSREYGLIKKNEIIGVVTK